MNDKSKQKPTLCLIIAGLILATVIAYEPVRHNDFVTYDENKYITENPNVKGGPTQESILRAFTSSHASNWHPLTWLSHTLDYELYGLNPIGHHITNLLLHIANTLLLFRLLQKTTGAIWKSAFVSAAFALHPVHVESVAWAAERKDVLSTFFWMLTILSYVRYTKRPVIGRYMLVIPAFALGLMSKPMLVTLPLVLLLLDYWPLNRLPIADCQLSIEKQKLMTVSWKSAIIEKVPLFVMSAGSCIITLMAQKSGGAVLNLTAWPWHARIVNALGSYFNYVIKILYPTKLAVLYPFEGHLSIQAALVAIIGAALILYYWGRGRRWLVTGLLWYLVTLVPVIGLVQVGTQMMADRYTYIPSIGIFIIIAWGVEEIVSGAPVIRYKKIALVLFSAAVIIAMIFLTRIQVSYWRDGGTLYKHAIDVTKNNVIMPGDYGHYLAEQGKYEEGMKYLMEAHRIYPNDMSVRENICIALLKQNKNDEASNTLTRHYKRQETFLEYTSCTAALGLHTSKKANSLRH